MAADLAPHQRRVIDALSNRRGITLDMSRPIVPASVPPTEPATAPSVSDPRTTAAGGSESNEGDQTT